jgi:hypothetical protein
MARWRNRQLRRRVERRLAEFDANLGCGPPGDAAAAYGVGGIERQAKSIRDRAGAHQGEARAERRNIANDAVAKRPVHRYFGALVNLGAPDSSALMHTASMRFKCCAKSKVNSAKSLICANQAFAERYREYVIAVPNHIPRQLSPQSGLNSGTGGPFSVSANTRRTLCPMRSASKSQSTTLVSMVGPSAKVT